VKNWYDVPSVAVDLDGTLTAVARGTPGDVPGEADADVVALIRRLHRDGWHIIVHTARPHPDHPTIATWLDDEAVPFDQIVCGKPNADVQIDDKGLLPAPHLLDAWVEWVRVGGDVLALDALANQRLRSSWATEQYAVPENPTATVPTDDRFVVAVPCSGGLDSITVAAMAAEAGLPRRLYYVDAGQPYAADEIATVRRLFGDELVVLSAPTPSERFDYLLPGRNAAVVWLIAADVRARGEWGEVWFGNLAGETPTIGGDKSARFFGTLQGLLTLARYDVRVVNPLVGLDKPDLVRWWIDRDGVDRAAATRTCFVAGDSHCGRCQACFRRLVAFEAAGIDTAGWWPPQTDWSPYVAKYRDRMGAALAAGDFSRYSPARCRSTLAVIDRLSATGRV
jgi:7-cyano-7-deazaguanine synthase in queuosine biosynthesis